MMHIMMLAAGGLMLLADAAAGHAYIYLLYMLL